MYRNDCLMSTNEEIITFQTPEIVDISNFPGSWTFQNFSYVCIQQLDYRCSANSANSDYSTLLYSGLHTAWLWGCGGGVVVVVWYFPIIIQL